MSWSAHGYPLRLITLLALPAARLAAAAPAVTRVEPPNWWSGPSLNPVRLLISGTNLARARVESPAGFDTTNLRVNDHGTYLYLFLDRHLPTNAVAGTVPLRIIPPAPFPLLNPLPRTNRFGVFQMATTMISGICFPAIRRVMVSSMLQSTPMKDVAGAKICWPSW